MTVMSDKWIVSKSVAPTHRLHNADPLVNGSFIRPPYSDIEKHAVRNWDNESKREFFLTAPYAIPLTPEQVAEFKPMIHPFVSEPVRYVNRTTGMPVILAAGEEPTESMRRIISYGTSSYGYDVRLQADADHIRIFTNVFTPEIDPKRMREDNFAGTEIRTDEDGGQYVLIPPHSYIQAPTMEYFHIPRDIMVIVVGKSTYARSGLICNVTPIEPEFEGEMTLQITNLTNGALRVYLGEGIAKLLFHTIDV